MNLFQQFNQYQYSRRDLWREARNKTRAVNILQSIWNWIVIFISGLLGKQAKPERTINGFLRQGMAFVVDLSSYQPRCNVEAMIDAGVTHFILRMLYPAQYVYDRWNLTEDSTYRSYYNRIRSYAKSKGKQIPIGAYVVYCAGVEDSDYAQMTVYTSLMHQIMGSEYIPDFLMIDDEVNRWSQNGGTVTATPTNQVKGVRELTRKCWNAFRLVTGHYSARWFMNQVAGGGSYLDQYAAWLDSVNRPVSEGGQGETVPGWYAWYPMTFSDIFSNPLDVVNKLPLPTSQQEVSLLGCGSWSPWSLWQFTGALVTPLNLNSAGQPAGVDASISRLCVAEFNAQYNIAAPVDTTPPLPPSGLAASLSGYSVFLTWTASQDAAYYQVYRDGGQIGEATAPAYTDQGTSPGAVYSYCVTALDQAGNESGPSNIIMVRIPGGDNDNPELEARVLELENWKAEVTAFFAGK